LAVDRINATALGPARRRQADARKALKELLPALQPVPLPVKQVLHRPGDLLDFVYFPEAGMVSIILPLEDDGTIEVGTAGQ
jgi:hypothetical protein